MPFKPKYTITNKILNNIHQITAGREVIEHARLIPKWELRLRKEARIHNAHSSTSIEGNKLSLKQVEALSQNKEIAATAKDKQEVINYLEAIDSIPFYAGKIKIMPGVLLEIHKKITKKTLSDLKYCGAYRDKQVFVGKRVFDGTGFREIVEYMPPPTKDVPFLTEEFLGWVNLAKTEETNPVLLAGIAHYEIARIHPFIDGNGRTARLFASLILYKSGFDHRRFFALDDYYDQDRLSYYAALKTAQQDKNDITRWLEYFTDGVLYSINKVKETIAGLSFAPGPSAVEQIELTQKQIKILQKLQEKGRITNRDLRAMFKVSRQAILKEILKLIDAKLIELVGKGRSAYYRMAK